MSEHSTDSIITLVGAKCVYIYGAGRLGWGWWRALEGLGLTVKGYIDSSVSGSDIFPLGVLEEASASEKYFVVVAIDPPASDAVFDRLREYGFEKNRHCVQTTQICDTAASIEVSGVCNLACASCDIKTTPAGEHAPRQMSLKLYMALFDKLKTEVPQLPDIYLYGWGEPLFNPELPEIIQYTQEQNVSARLSTNLNYCLYLEKVIAASPDAVLISCSGIGSNYQRTHTGGNWSLFARNLRRVRYYLDQFNAKTRVSIYYHLYTHNLGDDYDYMRDIADTLGFYWEERAAIVLPTTLFDSYVQQRPIPAAARAVSTLMCYSLEEQVAFSQYLDTDCLGEKNHFPNIRWDGSVVPCCSIEGNAIESNYLDVPLEEIKAKRSGCELCRKCRENRLTRLTHLPCKLGLEGGKRVLKKQFCLSVTRD